MIATAITEYKRNTGSLSSIIYDDLSKHATAYRQLCLFLKKPAGREAFPSDVFYLHARLLERSCALSARYSLGSLMSLPIIETFNDVLLLYSYECHCEQRSFHVYSYKCYFNTDGLDLVLYCIGVLPAGSTSICYIFWYMCFIL